MTHVLGPEPQKPFNWPNDGGADAKGRFFFGAMRNNIAPNGAGLGTIAHRGSLFRLDADMRLTAFEATLTPPRTSNQCSPDARSFSPSIA